MATNNSWNSQNPMQVAKGGTGRNTLTADSILVGNNTAPVSRVIPLGTGVPLISQGIASNPIFNTAQIIGGGTGKTSFTSNGVICAGVDFTSPFQDVGTGTSGQFLESNGPGALPSWKSESIERYSFFAYNNVADSQLNVTGDGTDYHVIFQTTLYNDGSVWDTVNSQFVAPVTGLYFFSYFAKLVASVAGDPSYVYETRLNGPLSFGSREGFIKLGPTVDSYTQRCCVLMPLSTGQIVYPSVKISGIGAKVAGVQDSATVFSHWITGYLVTTL